MNWLVWLKPWEFSPTLIVAFLTAGILFWRGQQRIPVNRVRQALFWTGMIILYLAMHTRLDYYAERMFFVHRIQHVVLHHLGPLLMMAAYPGSVMRAGMPFSWRTRLHRFRHTRMGHLLEGAVTNPWLVCTAFVLLVLIWLIPSIQFYTMLDWRLYRLMNWTVVLSGILYWNLLLDRRPSPPAAMSPGMRVLTPALTMTPQMVAGAILTFSERDFYPVYAVCGRALDFGAVFDQNLGGLIMWVPAGTIEAIGAIIALRTLMRLSVRGRYGRKSMHSPTPQAGSDLV